MVLRDGINPRIPVWKVFTACKVPADVPQTVRRRCAPRLRKFLCSRRGYHTATGSFVENLCCKRKGAIARPSPSVTKLTAAERSPAFAGGADRDKSRSVDPWFTLRCPSSVAAWWNFAQPTAEPNLGSSRRDAVSFRVLSSALHSVCALGSPSSFCLPCCPRPDGLDHCDTAFVTRDAKRVNPTDRNFGCGNFGNVEIV